MSVTPESLEKSVYSKTPAIALTRVKGLVHVPGWDLEESPKGPSLKELACIGAGEDTLPLLVDHALD